MSISGEESKTLGETTGGWRRFDLFEDEQEVGRLKATFQAAVEFGVPDKEIWAAIMDVSHRTSRDLDGSDPLEELSAALAAKILDHERSAYWPG
jgi:hypothetical protein